MKKVSIFRAEDDLGLTMTSGSEFVEWDRNLYEQQKQQTETSQYFQQKSDYYDTSQNEESWHNANLCVKQFIEDPDVLSNLKKKNNGKKVDNIYLHREGNDEESSYNSATKINLPWLPKKFVQSFERDKDCETGENISDAECSQISQTSSEESKTYSQVYNEIYEESIARQEKAAHFRRAFTNSIQHFDQCREQEDISKDRTQLWVEQLGQHEMNESSTESSSRSEKVSEYSHLSDKNSEWIYETVIEEQLVFINKYKHVSNCSSKGCFEDSQRQVQKVVKQQEGETTSSQQTNKNSFRENNIIAFDKQINAESVYNLKLPGQKSQKNLDLKYMSVNHTGNKRTEVLQFEHCEIYHIKQSDKNHSESVVSCVAVTERSCLSKAVHSDRIVNTESDDTGYRPNEDEQVEIETEQRQNDCNKLNKSEPYSESSRCSSRESRISNIDGQSDTKMSNGSLKPESKNSFHKNQHIVPNPNHRIISEDENTDVISDGSPKIFSAFEIKNDQLILNSSPNLVNEQNIFIRTEDQSCEISIKNSNESISSEDLGKSFKDHSFQESICRNKVSERSFPKNANFRQKTNHSDDSDQSDSEMSEDFSENKYRPNKSVRSSEFSSSSEILYFRKEKVDAESTRRSNYDKNRVINDISERCSIKSWKNIDSSENSHQPLCDDRNSKLSTTEVEEDKISSIIFARPDKSLEFRRSQCSFHSSKRSANNFSHRSLNSKISYDEQYNGISKSPFLEEDQESPRSNYIANLSERSFLKINRSENSELLSNMSYKSNQCSARDGNKKMSTSCEEDGVILSNDHDESREDSHRIDQLESSVYSRNSPNKQIVDIQNSSSCDDCSVSSSDKSSLLDSDGRYDNSSTKKVPKISIFAESEYSDKNGDEQPFNDVLTFDNNILSDSQLYLNLPNSSSSMSSKRSNKKSGEISAQVSSKNEINSIKESRDSNVDRRIVPRIVVYNLDMASFKIPSDLRADDVIFDGEEELLDITLSDDDMQIQAKLETAIFCDKKERSKNHSLNFTSSENRRSIGSYSSYQPSQIFSRRTEPEDESDEYLSEEDEPISYQKHVARLADRMLRSCPNYYSQEIQFKPKLDRDLCENAKMSNTSRPAQHFRVIERRKDEAELVQQFNERLERQVKLIAQRLQ